MMESKNLILRETTFGDCGIFSEWETKEDVKKFFSMDDDHGYEDVVRDFFTNVQDPSKRYFTITLKPEGNVIGRVYLSAVNRKQDSLDITRIYIADVHPTPGGGRTIGSYDPLALVHHVERSWYRDSGLGRGGLGRDLTHRHARQIAPRH